MSVSTNFSSLPYLSDLCPKDHTQCMYEMGLAYFMGKCPSEYFHCQRDITHKNMTRALELWAAAAALGDTESQFSLGIFYSTYFNPPQVALSVDAESDSPYVVTLKNVDVFETTMRLLKTNSNTFSSPEAARSLERSLKRKFDLTERFTNGAAENERAQRFPLRRSLDMSTLYLYGASQTAHVEALLALGFRHLYGLGVSKECDTAASYYIQVAREVSELNSDGISPAVETFRLMLSSTGFKKVSSSAAGAKTNEELIELFIHMAEAGNSKAQLLVARNYLFGLEHFNQDYKRAVHFFLLAARQDDLDAIAYLGYLSILGLGMEQNYDTAFKLLSHVTMHENHALANNGLGYMIYYGLGPLKSNHTLAAEYFNKSAERGFPDALYNLGVLYFTGSGVSQSPVQALTLLAYAFERGHAAAGYFLGVSHLNGLGTARDCELAAQILKSVAERHPAVISALNHGFRKYKEQKLDEATHIFWRLAAAGHMTAQSNLAFLLDSETYLDDSLPNFQRVIRRSLEGFVKYLPRWSRFRSAALNSFFSLTHDSSESLNRIFAQRFHELGYVQRSHEALIRLGYYALNGWGYLAASEDRVPENHTRKFSTLEEFYSAMDHLKAARNLSGWAAVEEHSDTYYIRRQPDYAEALAKFTLAQEKYFVSKDREYFEARAEFQISTMYQLGQGLPRDLYMASQHLSSMEKISPLTIPHAVVKALFISLRFRAALLYLKTRSLHQMIHDDGRILILMILVCAICCTLGLRASLKCYKRCFLRTQ